MTASKERFLNNIAKENGYRVSSKVFNGCYTIIDSIARLESIVRCKNWKKGEPSVKCYAFYDHIAVIRPIKRDNWALADCEIYRVFDQESLDFLRKLW